MASGAGSPRLNRSSQYTNAINMPIAPCATLNTPDVTYVTTNPEAATA